MVIDLLNVGDISCPYCIGLRRLEIAVEQMRRDRQVVLTFGGHHTSSCCVL